MATMTCELPHSLFAKTPRGAVDRSKGLQACPTYALWEGNGRDCYRVTMSERIASFCIQIRGANTIDGGDGGMLSEYLNSNILTQWDAICRFMETTYQQLVKVSGFTTTATWALIGRYLAAIFGEMRKFRTPLARLYPTTQGGTIKILWGIIQAHRVLDEFIAAKFTSHPTIVAEIGLFMLTERVDPARVNALEIRIKTSESTLVEAMRELKRVKEELETVRKSLVTDRNNFKNEMATLRSKVNKS